MNKNQLHTDRGFTILISAIISSIIITIGVSVVGMVKHQLLLTGVSEQSELAMSAADAGVECMTYWEQAGRFDIGTTTTNMSCINKVLPTSTISPDVPYEFSIDWATSAVVPVFICTKIVLTKTADSGTTKTTIESSGYNTACGNISDNPDVVERQIVFKR